jgi:hypothetical protein
MRSSRLLILASVVLAFLAVAFAVSPFVVAQQSTSQSPSKYVSYSITASNSTENYSAVVNETVTSSSTSGLSTLSLAVGSSLGNFSYSRLLNSSEVLFPYFPTIQNQSLSYQFHNYSISASISQVGTGSATFDGQSYPISNYAFQVSGSMLGGKAMSAIGQASVFPSGLVYSAVVHANGTYVVSVQLLSTNLSLNSSMSGSQSSSIAIAGGAGSVVAGIGAFALVRRERKKEARESGSENKPLYYVD